ncbi:methyltransferase [Buchnera aphidicola]|uniref:methyltransferase n=1 Tax=Buchnera aphidicola TaxID=9 RepID=UPI00094C54B5|nr:methyltransferase [Buchnera aphidicola]
MSKIPIKKIHKSKEFQFFKKNFLFFKKKYTILAGEIPEELCIKNFFKKSIILVENYNIYKMISCKIKKELIFNNLFRPLQLQKYKQLIFFWTKNKNEVKFQIMHLLPYISYTCKISLIGKKDCGINSVPSIFHTYLKFKKKNYSRNCCLYQGRIIQKPIFLLNQFIKIHVWNKLIIESLPGVFGYKKIDEGSKLLISTFDHSIRGNVLDIGSGTGILSIALLKKNSELNVTLVDIHGPSVWCSKKNLLSNNFSGEVFFSNIYSKVTKKYNLIISNPPIHIGIKINLKILITIIKNSKKYLKKNGELRLVINSFISCDFIFKKYDLNYKILLKTHCYKILQVKRNYRSY